MSFDGSVKITNNLPRIADSVPKIIAAALAAGVRAALDLLEEIMPLYTGRMREETYSSSNQYSASITSPVEYTAYQEYGFFNVWAGRWIPGRFFMMAAQIEMERVTKETLSRLMKGGGAL